MDLDDGTGQVGRQLRAAALSAVVVALSLVAHLSGGGASPPAAAVVAGWAVLAVVLAPVTGRALGLPLVLGLLTGGQLLVHVALTEAAAARTPAMTLAAARVAAATDGHAHHAMADMPSAAPGIAHASTMTPGPEAGGAMLTAHLMAALAIGVWLVAGERVAWALARVVTTVVRRSVQDLVALLTGLVAVLCPAVAGPPSPVRGTWWVHERAPELALGSASLRRGPPARVICPSPRP